MNRYSSAYQKFRIQQLSEENETLELFLIILSVLLILLIIRNWYNLYKKRSFRKKNEQIVAQLEANQLTIKDYEDKLKLTQDLEKKLNDKCIETDTLKKEIEKSKQKFLGVLNKKEKEKEKEKEFFLNTLNKKEKEIEVQKEKNQHQKKAYERYVDYKNVEANNTRLGAHFIKNVISQIYSDIEDIDNSFKTFLGIQYKIGKGKSKMPPIKALKNIFKLLDYNVAALNKENISIEEELKYINMFLDIIKYLKPNVRIKFDNELNNQYNSTLKIKPTLFFPFVENALKHGSLNDDNSFIKIVLKEKNNKQLSYCLVNSAEQKIHQENTIINTTSFGLNALKQLLNTYYPNSKLEHKILPNNQYLSELTLNLN